MLQPENNIAVTSKEISTIESYIQEKNTAVLTIMFTDIKGFTELTEQKGEQYATEFRKRHDAILTEIIEADGAGLIIKFIGDAVMAVFSEPSIAVERALKIQHALSEFNSSQQTFEPMRVRIGLHLGQVSISNTLQADVFGRHVNRAARIESLADGGQIYLSYSVFDSSKGWLANQNIIWENHGFYLLKGIDEAIEIYEVIAKEQGKPKPPLNAKKKRTFNWLISGLLVLIILLISGISFYFYQKTTVYLVRLYPENLYMDESQPISLDGVLQDQSRRILNEVSIGKHILYYDVSNGLRYYAELDVKRGTNSIEPKFVELRLPILESRLNLDEKNTETKSQKFNYVLYGKQGEKIPFNAELSVTVTSVQDIEAPDFIHDSYQGSLVLNGKTYLIKGQEFGHQLSDTNVQRIEPVLFYEDEYHGYYYKYYVANKTFQFDIYTLFKSVK